MCLRVYIWNFYNLQFELNPISLSKIWVVEKQKIKTSKVCIKYGNGWRLKFPDQRNKWKGNNVYEKERIQNCISS